MKIRCAYYKMDRKIQSPYIEPHCPPTRGTTATYQTGKKKEAHNAQQKRNHASKRIQEKPTTTTTAFIYWTELSSALAPVLNQSLWCVGTAIVRKMIVQSWPKTYQES